MGTYATQFAAARTGAEFKAQVLAECRQPGVSCAGAIAPVLDPMTRDGSGAEWKELRLAVARPESGRICAQVHLGFMTNFLCTQQRRCLPRHAMKVLVSPTA